MTRNLWILFKCSLNENTDTPTEIRMLYANGMCVHGSEIIVKTIDDLVITLESMGYREPGYRCNPEVLDYVVIVTEYAGGLLIKEFDCFEGDL